MCKHTWTINLILNICCLWLDRRVNMRCNLIPLKMTSDEEIAQASTLSYTYLWTILALCCVKGFCCIKSWLCRCQHVSACMLTHSLSKFLLQYIVKYLVFEICWDLSNEQFYYPTEENCQFYSEFFCTLKTLPHCIFYILYFLRLSLIS